MPYDCLGGYHAPAGGPGDCASPGYPDPPECVIHKEWMEFDEYTDTWSCPVRDCHYQIWPDSAEDHLDDQGDDHEKERTYSR